MQRYDRSVEKRKDPKEEVGGRRTVKAENTCAFFGAVALSRKLKGDIRCYRHFLITTGVLKASGASVETRFSLVFPRDNNKAPLGRKKVWSIARLGLPPSSLPIEFSWEREHAPPRTLPSLATACRRSGPPS